LTVLAAFVMVVTLAGLAFGLPALDRALPAERSVPADRPYPIGAGVSVVPPPGASVDLTRTRPGFRRGAAVLLLGPVRYVITVRPFRGPPDEAIARLRRRITANAGYQVTGAEVAVATDSGLTGRQGSYTAPGRGGRYAVYLVDGLAVEVTVTADRIDLGPVLAGIEASMRSIKHTSPG
jgi:hypothetical protein